MKRILFVDDDPQVFAQVQEMLAPLSGEWEVSFAPDADSALLLLSTTPFDVIVADLYMPRTDGPALLKSVREKWPGVVRIILAAQSEMEESQRAILVAHQCVLKPCDPNTLRNAVGRASSL